jgi:aspartyl-tRNA(Asn)/glutamyl-tRNA(Gln) amidotransferase subunit C
MAMINQEEVLKIAKLSGISMNAGDVELFTGQIQKVLSFIDELQSVSITTIAESACNVNILRNDIPESLTAISPLEQAPQRQENYFIVPKMVGEK